MEILYGLVGVMVASLVLLAVIWKYRNRERDRRAYEYRVAEWLSRRGWVCTVGKGTSDGGVDVLAVKGKDKVVVSCKYYTGTVGVRVVREIVGVSVEHGCRSAIATSGRLTKDAQAFVRKVGVWVIRLE